MDKSHGGFHSAAGNEARLQVFLEAPVLLHGQSHAPVLRLFRKSVLDSVQLSLDSQVAFLDLGVLPSHDAIRITPSVYGMRGSLWAKERNHHQKWMLDLQVRVHGPGTIGGHGFALWYVKDRGVPYRLQLEKFPTALDPTGQSLGEAMGALPNWDGVGIFFDTYDWRHSQVNWRQFGSQCFHCCVA